MYPRLVNRSNGYFSYKLKYFREKKSDTQQEGMMIVMKLSKMVDHENIS